MSGIVRDCTCSLARHTHGTEQAYISDLCRCPECKAAHAVKAARRRRLIAYGQWPQTTLPNIGTRRRLHALACNGWSMNMIAAMIGTSPRALNRLRDQSGVSVGRARDIAALYDELWDKKPVLRCKGDRISYAKMMHLAARHGYAPPMAWDDIDDPDERPHRSEIATVDEVAVQRVVTGHTAVLNRDEKEQARRLMEAKGLSSSEIARRLGTSARTVVRKRAAS